MINSEITAHTQKITQSAGPECPIISTPVELSAERSQGTIAMTMTKENGIATSCPASMRKVSRQTPRTLHR